MTATIRPGRSGVILEYINIEGLVSVLARQTLRADEYDKPKRRKNKRKSEEKMIDAI
jgi:hypothetical protein